MGSCGRKEGGKCFGCQEKKVKFTFGLTKSKTIFCLFLKHRVTFSSIWIVKKVTVFLEEPVTFLTSLYVRWHFYFFANDHVIKHNIFSIAET